MDTLILVVHLIVSLFLIVVVLLQAGKGASIGASFGGSNQTLFGTSQGSFVGKTTAVAATLFMLTSLSLAYISSSASSSSVMEGYETPAPIESLDLGSQMPDQGAAGEGQEAPKAE
ncbi:MAG: preprotein translocase subunit SecG [Deltaproteobacteria bacterium]|nr:preprotein translocase subunit SecG [Deltaproteobacteria bacterium]